MVKNNNLTLEETFGLATKNHIENRIDIAQNYYYQVLKINPNHFKTLNNLGVISLDLKEYKKAKEFFEKAIKIDPNNADSYNNLGISNKSLQEYQLAKECYKKAIKLNPNFVNPYNNLGLLFQELKDHQNAKIFFGKAIEINPDYLDAHNNLGVLSINLKDYRNAKKCLEKVIKLNPNQSNSQNNLGIVLQEIGKNKEAKECFEKAIKLNPNNANAYSNLGIVLQEIGKNKEAKECFEKAIKLNPNNANAYSNLGIVLQEIGKNKEAKECFEKAIKINPEHADCYNNLGTMFQDLDKKQNAKECFEKAIKIDPKHADALDNLGNLFLSTDQYRKAKSYFEKVINNVPNHINALNNLAFTFEKLNEFKNAINYIKRAIELDPNNQKTINTLTSILSKYKLNSESKTDYCDLKNLFLILFRNKNNDHDFIFQNAKSLLFVIYEQDQLLEVINSDIFLESKILQNLLQDELFLLMLQKSLIKDQFLEKLLTKLRNKILNKIVDFDKEILKKYFNYIISLAEQSWLNEYIYDEAELETKKIDKLKNKIEKSKQINEIEIAILGCYIPLNKSKIIIEKLFNYKSTNNLFNDLINLQIKEPLKEDELAKSIKSLGNISDDVSKKVRKQYEENPYPRWRFTHKIIPSNFFSWLNSEIKPNKVDYINKLTNPNVLVAGCGTGSHILRTERYKNANILAVDLSKSSLAYAKRKTEELGYKNVEYLHADILQLKKLSKKFDIIESAGTLHHMKDPIAGLKVLLEILEPSGFLKLGLYSETARKHITNTRQIVKKRNLKITNKSIKAFRQEIINEKQNSNIQKIIDKRDFYSLSMIRDLLFHVQEHRFTIPQISKILSDLDLEFLGFNFIDDYIKNEFTQIFPEDKNNVSLDNWHHFELNNPDIFIGMYQFWVKKK